MEITDLTPLDPDELSGPEWDRLINAEYTLGAICADYGPNRDELGWCRVCTRRVNHSGFHACQSSPGDRYRAALSTAVWKDSDGF
jgi:hypothetical protein